MTSSPRSPLPASPSAAHARTTKRPKRRWRIGKRQDTFDIDKTVEQLNAKIVESTSDIVTNHQVVSDSERLDVLRDFNVLATTTHHPVEILRFNTCGSVDDGKSTLIGRLLFDSKSLMEDQLEALQRSADITGGGQINLANLTDGLRAEREQGITIDVAYRYFATPRRKFIIADTPGHVQYTRNMVTGASSANLSIVLVDARNGVIEQSRRHTCIASLLRIPHVVIAVNKMDLVGWSEDRFWEIRDEMEEFLPRLGIKDVTFIPISALTGDNVVDLSNNMPWYKGPTLLGYLETVHIASDWNLNGLRLPVQWVNRPNNPLDTMLHDFRGFSGQIAGGIVRVGQ